jgi:hypothetical protein
MLTAISPFDAGRIINMTSQTASERNDCHANPFAERLELRGKVNNMRAEIRRKLVRSWECVRITIPAPVIVRQLSFQQL